MFERFRKSKFIYFCDEPEGTQIESLDVDRCKYETSEWDDYVIHLKKVHNSTKEDWEDWEGDGFY